MNALKEEAKHHASVAFRAAKARGATDAVAKREGLEAGAGFWLKMGRECERLGQSADADTCLDVAANLRRAAEAVQA